MWLIYISKTMHYVQRRGDPIEIPMCMSTYMCVYMHYTTLYFLLHQEIHDRSMKIQWNEQCCELGSNMR